MYTVPPLAVKLITVLVPVVPVPLLKCPTAKSVAFPELVPEIDFVMLVVRKNRADCNAMGVTLLGFE